MAWSRPRPASTQTTIRSRASGSPRKICSLRRLVNHIRHEFGQVEHAAGDEHALEQVLVSEHGHAVEVCQQDHDTAAEEQADDQHGELHAQEQGRGRFAAEPGLSQSAVSVCRHRSRSSAAAVWPVRARPFRARGSWLSADRPRLAGFGFLASCADWGP